MEHFLCLKYKWRPHKTKNFYLTRHRWKKSCRRLFDQHTLWVPLQLRRQMKRFIFFSVCMNLIKEVEHLVYLCSPSRFCFKSFIWFLNNVLKVLLQNWMTLAPCFPPAVVRGARRQRRRRGAVNGRPAPLPCEHEEDRNRRSPLPREPNAKTSYRGGLLSLHSISCVVVVGGVPTVISYIVIT